VIFGTVFSSTTMRLSRSALTLCLVLGVTTASNVTQSTVCGELASVLPDQVYFSDAQTYNASITSYPFIQLRLHPNCIVRPRSSQDISVALGILKHNNGTRFAVKGGGHNANAGFNNVDNGVTIDMQSMKTVEVERGDKVVRVAAGALSQDAYDAAEKKNLTVLAGRIGVVGTGGFLTGGMYTPLDNCLLILLFLLIIYQAAFRFCPLSTAGHATLSLTSKLSSQAEKSSTRTQHLALISSQLSKAVKITLA
jgi:hypothetical protein